MSGRDDYDVVQIVLFVALLAIVGAGFAAKRVTWDPWQCTALTEGMRLQHRFKFIGGCQVQTRDGWVPLKNYRAL